MLVDIIQNRHSVEVSYINEHGQIDIATIPAKFENWVKCDEDDPDVDPEFRNWTGEFVKKEPGYRFMDLNLREFLIKNAPKDVSDKIFAYNRPNYYTADIEIDVRTADGFPEAHEAKYPIASISVTNMQLSTVIFIHDDMQRIPGTEEYRKFIEDRVNAHFKEDKIPQELIAKHAPTGKLEYNHVIFKSEVEMMNSWFEMQRKYFHCIIGQNWQRFDAPYIFNRCRLIGVDQAKASPKYQMDEKWKMPVHRFELDYIPVMDKFMFDIWKTSLSLNYIASEALGVAKVEYDGSFLDLFMDRDNFTVYSAVDTILLMMIHLQKDYVSSLEMLSYYAKIPIQKAFSTMQIGDALFFDEQYANKIIYCHSDKQHVDESDGRDKYEGGFVVDPRYSSAEWIVINDFEGLYPKSMMSGGYSPDIILKENATLEEQKEAAKLGHKISMYGCIYDGHKQGLVDRLISRLVFERKHFKQIMLQVENDLKPIVEEYYERAKKQAL